MSKSLDITDDALRELSAQSIALVMDYFERISELPVFPGITAEQIAEQLPATLPAEGEPLETLMADCRAPPQRTPALLRLRRFAFDAGGRVRRFDRVRAQSKRHLLALRSGGDPD